MKTGWKEPSGSSSGWIWCGGFFLILLVNLVWELLDARPPVWDMAHHQMMGWHHLDAMLQGDLLSELTSISNYYPPLYYLLEAFGILIVGASDLLPFVVNLPGLFLLSFGTYRLGMVYLPSFPSMAAGWLTLLFPLVAWTSRESLIDPMLSGIVAISIYFLVRSNWLLSTPWSLCFGFVAGAGMLTKWTYIVFLAPAVMYSFFRERFDSRVIRNAMDAALICIPLTFWWYLPNLQSLMNRFELTSEGAGWEQDPGLSSLLGWLYYPRSLSGYYLFLPLTVLFVISLVRIYRRGADELDRFLLILLGTSLLLLTFLEAKDPRYVMPVVPLVALLLVSGWKKNLGWVVVVVGIGLSQFLVISFPPSFIPEKVALFALQNDTDYVGMGREWVLFETTYFGVTGPPVDADWRYGEILSEIPSEARVGFVPDAPFFNPVTFRLMARRRGKSVNVDRLGVRLPVQEELQRFGWIVGKTGDQGISYITRYNQEVYSMLESLNWPKVKSWHLPSAADASLWQNPTPSQ